MNIVFQKPDLSGVKPGDKVVRLIAEELPATLTVSEVTPREIICGDWLFDRDTGLEIDSLLEWGPQYGKSGSRLTGLFIEKAETPKESSVAAAGFISNHFNDADGVPAGGSTYGRGFAISWQNGPLMQNGVREEPNGAFVEDVIQAAADRIKYYQQSKFACDENKMALVHLEIALMHLKRRTENREARGVEGTKEV
jgi:hypothetical protein